MNGAKVIFMRTPGGRLSSLGDQLGQLCGGSLKQYVADLKAIESERTELALEDAKICIICAEQHTPKAAVRMVEEVRRLHGEAKIVLVWTDPVKHEPRARALRYHKQLLLKYRTIWFSASELFRDPALLLELIRDWFAKGISHESAILLRYVLTLHRQEAYPLWQLSLECDHQLLRDALILFQEKRGVRFHANALYVKAAGRPPLRRLT